MKNEAEFCTCVKNSIVCGFKIPDPTGQWAMTIKRAFDGIGMVQKGDELHFLCWEAKFLKDMSAFSFKRVEEHQAYYLTQYKKAKNTECYLIVGIDCGRADKRAYIFDWNEDFNKLYEAGFSIHKKYLEKLKYNLISKGTFKLENILTIQNILDCYGVKTLECLFQA